jgi:hypothetical protein
MTFNRNPHTGLAVVAREVRKSSRVCGTHIISYNLALV